MEETLSAYGDLIKAGKVRSIGASNFSRERLLESLDVSEKYSLPRYATLQPRYNLYDREEYERELSEFCVKNQIGVISYYSLASGFLTGKYRSLEDLSKSSRGGGGKSYLDGKGMEILKKLDLVSSEYQATPAQVSLAWLMARPGIVAPIASATTLTQLEDIMNAAELELTSETMAFLSET